MKYLACPNVKSITFWRKNSAPPQISAAVPPSGTHAFFVVPLFMLLPAE
jgi:hypothetical protein